MPKALITCDFCAGSFAAYPSQRKGVNTYCSSKCAADASRKWANCLVCGAAYTHRAGRLYCSAACTGTAGRKRVTLTCERCGNAFERPQCEAASRYCSKECHYGRRVSMRCVACGIDFVARQTDADSGRRFCGKACYYRSLEVWRTCARCGDAYQRGKGGGRKFCGPACQAAAQRTAGEAARVSRTCEACGASFDVIPSKTDRRYCSRPCWQQTRAVRPRVCPECGIEFKPRNQKGVYCSASCRATSGVRRMAAASPTSIEVETYRALTALGVEFEPQRKVGRWIVDAFLPQTRTVVEAFGTFHHCDPRRYPNGPEYSLQKKTVEKEQRRAKDFAAAGYGLVVLWESDIKEHGAEALLRDALGLGTLLN